MFRPALKRSYARCSCGNLAPQRTITSLSTGVKFPYITSSEPLNQNEISQRQAQVKGAMNLATITLNARQMCDIELLLNGGFDPLRTYMSEEDLQTCYAEGRLSNGQLWPIPIYLDVSAQLKGEIRQKIEDSSDARVALRDGEGNLMAIAHLDESQVSSDQFTYQIHKRDEAHFVYGGDDEHPAIQYLQEKTADFGLNVKALEPVQLPFHYDYLDLRKTPQEVCDMFKKLNYDIGLDMNVVAFQTRNPMHRAHVELVRAAAAATDAHVLLHPVVGLTKAGDIDYHTRMKVYQTILPRLTENLVPDMPGRSARLSALPLAMRMAGPREALWHALIRKNYGATHFIVGRDHAGPGSNSAGVDFYGPNDARDYALAHEDEAGIKIVPFDAMVYLQNARIYMPISQDIPPGDKALSISGTQVRKALRTGDDIPEWFSYPDVVKILRQVHPPLNQQGLTLFFTGLSGSGKSTIAKALEARLLSADNGGAFRSVTLLDGDEVRLHLSKGLGFSKEDRNINIERIGYVASEITKARGVAITCAIAPYESARNQSREMVSQHGNFIEVYIDTPVEECSKRDRKGLYEKARKGLLKGMTGIDDPYEEPQNPEIKIDSSNCTVSEAVDQIMEYLVGKGLLQDEQMQEKLDAKQPIGLTREELSREA